MEAGDAGNTHRLNTVMREGERVMPLELFFDLVFVLALTQCTALMLAHPTWEGLAQGTLVLALLWWTWAGYAWLTSVVDPEEGGVRIALFGAMAGLLIAALCVPQAFGDRAVEFALAYGVVRAGHIALFLLASRDDAQLRRSVAGLAASTSAGAGLLLAGALVGGTGQAVLWGLSLAIDAGGPFFFGTEGWRLSPAHFAERHGLIVIIALGESVVALGIGANVALTVGVAAAAILGIALIFELWWVYFDVVAIANVWRLVRAPAGREQNALARDVYSYLHLPLVLGIELAAVGLHDMLARPEDELHTVSAFALLGGVAIYLLGHVAIRLRGAHTVNRQRLGLALVLFALVPLAVNVEALVPVGAATAMLAAMIVYETRYYGEGRTRFRHEYLVDGATARFSPWAARADLSPVLRDSAESGDYRQIGELLTDDAVLDTSSELGRRRLHGPEAIVAHLSRPGPGEIVEWEAEDWPSGVAATFEWRGEDTVDRRRWYVRRTEGSISGIWSYAARAVSDPDPAAELPPAVLEQIGAGARREPLSNAGNSGAALERVRLPDGTRLVAKRVGPAADWLGRVTRDRGRTALLWEAGAFDRMPNGLDHGIEAVISDGDAWWVIMRDLSATFLGERRLTREESRGVLGVAAAVHAEFEGDVPDGAAAIADRLGMSSLRVAASERAGSDLLPKQLEAAWDAFADAVDDDVAAEVLSAVADPAPLGAALLAAGPATLLHGDLRDDNLGLAPDAVVLLDWDLATAGTRTVEFAWYLCHDAWRIDAGHDEIEVDYRAAEGDAVQGEELELGMLTGLVQYGWIFGHSLRVHPDPAEQRWAREELDWWVPRTRTALERAGGMPR